MLKKQSVPPQLLKNLDSLMEMPELSEYRLVGGTALSLQLGHRLSVDIDLFTDTGFNKDILVPALYAKFPNANFDNALTTSYGLTFINDGVKIDIFNDWTGKFLKPVQIIENIRLAYLENIAAMKLSTICSRLTIKDVVDLAELSKIFSLYKMVAFYEERHPKENVNSVLSAFKNLTKHNPKLENQLPPIFINQTTWEEYKELIKISYSDYIDFMIKKGADGYDRSKNK